MPYMNKTSIWSWNSNYLLIEDTPLYITHGQAHGNQPALIYHNINGLVQEICNSSAHGSHMFWWNKTKDFSRTFQDQISHIKDFYGDFHNADIPNIPHTVETPYSTIPYTTKFYITRWTHGPQNLQRPIRTLIVLLGFWIKQIFV